MEKETKQMAGVQDAQKSEFIRKANAAAVELRALANEAEGEVFLVACDHHTITRLLVGGEKSLPMSVALAMTGDEEGRKVMMKTFVKWLEMLDVKTAEAVTRALYETVQEVNAKTKHPRAEA
ncbi:hypothetical protein BHU11_07940 [Tannerella sp. oral taxon 808]|nr:hypothetical protein BHU11_07940 [Tannerella sp. oral taxon 808]